jgi:hypothetical protein
MNKIFIVALSLWTFISLESADAQSYAPIDDNLNLYCSTPPSGSNVVARVTTSRGSSVVNPIDPDQEIRKIVSIRKGIEKRISALRKMQRGVDDKSNLRKIYKFVTDEVIDASSSDVKFDNLKPAQISKRISYMIGQLTRRQRELQAAVDLIRRCLNNENILVSRPTILSSGIIRFQFEHPDYRGQFYEFRGIGVNGVLHKSRSRANICVSGATGVGINLPGFPRERTVVMYDNPCSIGSGFSFRNFPSSCDLYGPAVAWISEPSFGTPWTTAAQLRPFEFFLEQTNGILARVPTKKNPCRN